MKIHFGSFVRSGTVAAVVAGFLYLLALTPFLNNLLVVLFLAGAVLIPFGAGLYYGFLAPGEETMGQSVIGGALSGLVAGIIIGIAVGINAFMLTAASTGVLGYAVAGGIGVTLLSAAIFGVFAAIIGALGGVLWRFIQKVVPASKNVRALVAARAFSFNGVVGENGQGAEFLVKPGGSSAVPEQLIGKASNSSSSRIFISPPGVDQMSRAKSSQRISCFPVPQAGKYYNTTLSDPVITIIDGKYIVPAVAVKSFDEAISPLKNSKSQIEIIPVEERFQANRSRLPFQNHRRVLPDVKTVFVQLINDDLAQARPLCQE